MLNALSDITEDDARKILVDLTFSLLPTPKEHHLSAEAATRLPSVLAELRDRLGLSPEDDSREARSKLLRTLGQELSAYTTTAAALDRARARLAERDDLPSSDYRVSFAPAWRQALRFRDSEPDVEDVVRQPDSMATANLAKGQTGGETVALFVKRRFTPSRDDYVVIVQTSRRKAEQLVMFSWRVYIADIKFEGTHDAVAVLRAFVDVFGVEREWGPLGRRKFIESAILPFVPNIHLAVVGTFSPNSRSVIVSMSGRPSTLGVFEFAWIFAIDTEKYLAALRSHGAPL